MIGLTIPQVPQLFLEQQMKYQLQQIGIQLAFIGYESSG
jgi:hypothetical protein